MSGNLNTAVKLVKKGFAFQMKQNEVLLYDFIIEELKNIELKDLKLDAEFIKYLCELIENQVKSSNHEKTSKPNKLDIFKAILLKLFPQITNDELAYAVKIVEFLLKNKLVKRTKLSAVMKFFLSKIFSA